VPEDKKVVFSLTIYDDHTFKMRSAKREIEGEWKSTDSLLAAITVLLLGVAFR